MKKIVLSILLLMFIVPCLFCCGEKEYIKGTDAAKILLAQERLNENVINGSSNLFTTGKEAFDKVVRETRKYNKKFAGRPNETYVEVEGDTYKWYNDNEYSNFNSFFESYAVNIEHSAERGSELIDYVKKNIRVVNVWVKDSDIEYYLKVDETSEMIFTREDDSYHICKRTTDENGNDVYELLDVYNDTTLRMKYIPGLLYEFAILQNEGEGYSHYLIADKSKGYWNIISTNDVYTEKDPEGNVVEHTNYQALMMKEEAYYLFSYSLDNQGWSNGKVDTVTLISNDGKTDLVTISAGMANLFNTGIRGLDHIEITASKEYVGDFDPNDTSRKYVYIQDNVDENNKPYKIYSTSGFKSATAVLENGQTLNEGDRFLDDKVSVGRIDVSYVAGCDAYGSIPLRMSADNLDETLSLLVEFLEETGLTFRRDLETVLAGAEFALNDVKNFHEFFQFNGYNIDSLENAKKAAAQELAKIENLKDEYELIKDALVIKYRNQAEMDKHIYFADIEVLNAGTITNNGFNISVSDLKVKVDDTILFVDEEKYKVVLALLKDNGSIVPLNANGGLDKAFVEGSSFEVSQTASYEIALTDEGIYALVAYVATAEEGIRVTKTFTVTGSFSKAVSNKDGVKLILDTNAQNNLLVNAEYDFNINIETSEKLTYNQLVHFMEQSAYNHGMVDGSSIEVLQGSEWVDLEKTSGVIAVGQYRMKYIVTLENVSGQEGYIFVTIS